MESLLQKEDTGLFKTDENRHAILIYGGTTEGRKLADFLCGAGFLCTVCVATQYGEEMLVKNPGLSLRRGRMDAAQMKELADSGDFFAVVDATHPFACEVSENIRASLSESDIPYIRLKRVTALGKAEKEPVYFADMESCALALKNTEGNILLTTGSGKLNAFCMDHELKKRLFVRVLPCKESLFLCEQQGIKGRQIIAMQGPFSAEMNEAVIREFQIKVLVTKESGAAGGYDEKLKAALHTDTKVYVIGNPEKDMPGYSFEETVEKLYPLSGRVPAETKQEISLIGMGMGRESLLTIEAKEALDHADVVFGSKRLISGKFKEKETYPLYRPEEILPVIRKNYARGRERIRIAVLFSGDTGFYSGADKLYGRITEEDIGLNCEVRIFPGISAMSYLAAAGGISQNDTAILSIHGRKADIDIVKIILEHEKTFLLVSGAEDLRWLGGLLAENGLGCFSVLVGYQLSYPEEEIRRMTAEECKAINKEGLYCCYIENDKNRMPQYGSSSKEFYSSRNVRLSHGMKDDSFIRGVSSIGRIPMTKEEIREVSICKLGLCHDSILYDIGSGTGSVAVECALLSSDMQVYAVEKNKEAAELTAENCRHFGASNVKLIEAAAPAGLALLPAPTHAFIGGSGGNIKEILRVLYEKNNRTKVVMNAVTLETISSMTALLKEFPLEEEEVIQIQVNRLKKAGTYHLMQAENAVFILSFRFLPQEIESK